MPFITEELWQSLREHLPQGAKSIMVAPYPDADESAIDAEAEEGMEAVIEVIKLIRNAEAEHHIESTRWIEAIVNASEKKSTFESQSEAIRTLAKVRPLTIIGSLEESPVPLEDIAVFMHYKGIDAMLLLRALFDPVVERKRLGKEISRCEAEIERLEAKLVDTEFIIKAPPVIIERERQRLAVYRGKLQKLTGQLARLANR
jgi:valyl-tRNA synthetase